MFVSFDAGQGIAEIGCWLEPAGTGRGLITRAVGLLIDWAIRTRGLSRIEWRCRPDNVASAAVARRLGMRHEATLRSSFPYAGVRHDTQIWALLAEDA
jgi:ribosomal-protein-serine acetyltransferase